MTEEHVEQLLQPPGQPFCGHQPSWVLVTALSSGGSDSELRRSPLSQAAKVCGEHRHRLVLLPGGSTKTELPVRNVQPRMREDLALNHPGKVP